MVMEMTLSPATIVASQAAGACKKVWIESDANWSEAAFREKVIEASNSINDESTLGEAITIAGGSIPVVAYVYAVMAMQADRNGESLLAWKYASDTSFLSGMYLGRTRHESPAKLFARLRHAETDSCLVQAHEHWRTNLTNLSNIDAAEVLVKIVPLAIKTLADRHIPRWKRGEIPPYRG